MTTLGRQTKAALKCEFPENAKISIRQGKGEDRDWTEVMIAFAGLDLTDADKILFRDKAVYSALEALKGVDYPLSAQGHRMIDIKVKFDD